MPSLRLVLFGCFVLMLAVSGAGADNDRLTAAAAVLDEIMQIPDKSIPLDLFTKASCVVIVPDLKKGAFVVGGKYGRGYFSCRKKQGGWSAPGAVRVEGGSVGFQIGATASDLVMLVMNSRGVDRLLSNKFTVGVEGSVAAGPVGRDASAETDATMRAEMLAWSRSRGVFAGISLEGATLREDHDENRLLYGRDLSNRTIVTGQTAAPLAAAPLLAALKKY